MIADDDERMLRALDKVLTGQGANVIATKWAGDAIDVLTQRDRSVDLVITDLRMPIVTGATLVYAVHQIFPDLPVIVLTAFGDSALKTECLHQGAAAFLEKPLDTSQLLTAIAAVFASVKIGKEADQLEHGRKIECHARKG